MTSIIIGKKPKCACCDAPAILRARWFVTGPGWTEQDLCDVHAAAASNALSGAIASLRSPPYTLGAPGVPIFGIAAEKILKHSSQDDLAALRDVL